MKKIISIMVLALLFASTFATAADYYVDSKQGSDSNSGRSQQEAWASLKKANKKRLKPGDRLLFRSGTKYHGQLVLRNSGTASQPIIVSAYGEGPYPQIHGKGMRDYTVLLDNAEYIELSKLEITNMARERKARRTGILVRAVNSGELHNIVLRDLTIHHVNGSLIKKQGGGRAIYTEVRGDEVKSRFINLHILDNHIYHTARNGIGIAGTASRENWYPHLGVVIRGNLIEQVPGDGIVVVGSDGALIEGNLLRDFPDVLPKSEAAAGIWPWSSDNTVIQFNEVSGHKAKWDGQGYDSDFNSIGTIIQHNYSHDNYGGFLLVCNKGETFGQDRNIGTRGSIIRHNVSFNDGIRPYPARNNKIFSPTFHLSGPIEDTHIHGNVIIIPKKGEGMDNTLIQMDNWGGPWPRNSVFEGNEFYFGGEMKVELNEVTDVIFQSNRFYGSIERLGDGGNDYQAEPLSDLEQLRMEALERKIRKPRQAMVQPDLPVVTTGPGDKDT